MPLKSIIDVEVNDTKFKEYQEALAKSANVTSKMSAETKATFDAYNKITAALIAQTNLMQRLTEQMGKLGAKHSDVVQHTKTAAFHWGAISRHVKDVAGHIWKATNDLINWRTTLAGLLGVGGTIWGLDTLAAHATMSRRTSNRLGFSYGQYQSLDMSLKSYIDTPAYMTAIARAKGNSAGPEAASLWRLGINPNTSGNAFETSLSVLTKIIEETKGLREGDLGQYAKNKGTESLGIGSEDIRYLQSHPAEILAAVADARKKATDLNISDPKLKKWSEFLDTLDEAGRKIKVVLIEHLDTLLPSLTAVSEGFKKMVEKIVGGEGSKNMLETIAKGLEKFGEYIGSGRLLDDLKRFGETLGRVADALGKLFPGDSPERVRILEKHRNKYAGQSPNFIGRSIHWIQEQFGIAPHTTGETGGTPVVDPRVPQLSPQDTADHDAAMQGGGGRKGGARGRSVQGFGGGHSRSRFGGGLDAYSKAIAGIESGGNYGALGPVTRGDRPYGKYQVMGANIPGWTKQALGVSMTPMEFLNSPSAQEAVFQKIFGDLVRKHGGADAASIWHSGRPLSQAGGAHDRLGTYTTDYVARVMAAVAAGGGGTTLNINDNTGGSVIMSTQQAGYAPSPYWRRP